MRIAFLLPLALAACTASPRAVPDGGPDPAPAPQDRIAAECALLDRAVTMLAANGTPAHDGLTEGCPGVAARDTRPLPEQLASLRAANAAALPPAMQAGTRAEAVYRRMITRGVPVSLALHLTSDPLFSAAAR
ncbi:hypothetical protein [Pararhodobacter zhoushanensis]|uniref:hypothetical protein n=1 Tax=Pararhodobacter zhoushanensis TaxID=2479545 RepID=UPI000F8E2E30|nr:hypothetical protein [Pararhodobacter zhoushanensis]